MTKTTILTIAAAAVAGMIGLAPGASAATACATGTVAGAYAVLLNGYVGHDPVVASGQLTADGDGGLTGTFSFSKRGLVRTDLEATGSYSVSTIGTACIGTLTLNLPENGVQHYQFAINSGGAGFVGLQTDRNTTVSLVAKQ